MSLQSIDHQFKLYAGVRNIGDARIILDNYEIELTEFDFTDSETYVTALNGCDFLFLLRPPQLSEVDKYFKPIIDTCKDKAVKHIIFLSVQGVEKSKIIPHHKIEKLIVDSKIPYTFLRPAYFMQNFTTTLRNDLVNKRRIYLPAGSAKFTLIDVRDIGSVTASILTKTSQHVNKSYELTSKEKLDIHFKSPNLVSFFLAKRKEKMPTMLILVMIMLHYLPRFQNEPKITDSIEKIIHRQPITFKQFIIDNKKLLTK
jgi:hypothetical protein